MTSFSTLLGPDLYPRRGHPLRLARDRRKTQPDNSSCLQNVWYRPCRRFLCAMEVSMANGAQAVRSMELGRSSGRDGLSIGLPAGWARAGGAGATCADSRGMSADSILRSASRSAHFVRGSLNWKRENPMNTTKYEKSFDNRCAALMSRDGTALRAGQDHKLCMAKGLRLMSLPSRSRGGGAAGAGRPKPEKGQPQGEK